MTFKHKKKAEGQAGIRGGNMGDTFQAAKVITAETGAENQVKDAKKKEKR